MIMGWKTAFSICALALVISNVFWLQVVNSWVTEPTLAQKESNEMRQSTQFSLGILPLVGRAMTRTTLISIAKENYPDEYWVDGNTVYIGWLKFNIVGGRIGSVEGLTAAQRVEVQEKARAN